MNFYYLLSVFVGILIAFVINFLSLPTWFLEFAVGKPRYEYGSRLYLLNDERCVLVTNRYVPFSHIREWCYDGYLLKVTSDGHIECLGTIERLVEHFLTEDPRAAA